MSSGTDKRRGEVLRAIVADFIASQEPVGSKSLVERYQLGVSSATVRNDMAVLESEGLITQPHASSGRVPTQKGYREFVDTIHDVRPLSKAERNAMISFLERGVDLEDVLYRSAQLLAQVTRQAAVVQMPNLEVSRVKHCEVVALSPFRLLLVLITDSGRVDQRNVDLSQAIDDEDTVRLREALNRALVKKTFKEASSSLAALADAAPSDLSAYIVPAATILAETLVDHPTDKLLMAGASNLTRVPASLAEGLPTLVEALEEQVTLLKLLARVPEMGNVAVVIGDEHEEDQLRSSSVVSAAYGAAGETLGGMGVVGPTFMDYSGTIARVSAVARYVSDIVGPQ